MKLLGTSALIASAASYAIEKSTEDKVDALQQKIRDIKAGRQIGGLKYKIQEVAEDVFDFKFADKEEKFNLMWQMYEDMNGASAAADPCADSFGHLESWGTAVTAQDKAWVLSHYTEDGSATLWPTLSNLLRESEYWIGDYFDLFLAKIAGTDNVVWNHNVCQPAGDNYAMWSGTYTFTLKEAVAVARYSYLLTKSPEYPTGWQIVHHHSSLMPEPYVAPVEGDN